jgi:tRNA_anti-like
LGVAGLVLGILGLLLGLVVPILPIGAVLSLIALVLGIFGRKQATEQGQATGTATAGIVLGAIGLVLGSLIFSWCYSCERRAERGWKDFKGQIETEIEKEKNRQNRPLDTNVTVVTAKQIVTDYKENELAADAKYKDKTVEVSGVVQTVSKDLFDKAYVSLESGDPVSSVQVYFEDSEASKIMSLKTGQRVTVRGRVDGFMISVMLKKSILVK